MKAATASTQPWHGSDRVEAMAAYGRAIKAGLSELRSRILGSVSSRKDCWASQASLAEFHHCSVRTVQRACHDGREKGFIRCAFGKPGEMPPGAKKRPTSKWSHRWTIGRGLAGKALQKAIDAARAAWVICQIVPKRTFNEPQPVKAAKAKAKLRNPPSHLSREQRAQWIEDQMQSEPLTREDDEREPKPPD